MSITYKNSADKVTLEEAMAIYSKNGVCVVVNDGKDITFDDEI